MKRDMELIRKILSRLEEATTHDIPVQIYIEGYQPEEINYNIGIAQEGGLLELFGTPVRNLNSTTRYLPARLTWEGHDFLDASKNDDVWKKTMKTVRKKGGGMAFEVIKALLIQYAKEEFTILTH